MKASILIANYNNENFIEDCINSLLHQTYKNIEIIFFDDQSSDNSIKKVKKFDKVNLIINSKKKKNLDATIKLTPIGRHLIKVLEI